MIAQIVSIRAISNPTDMRRPCFSRIARCSVTPAPADPEAAFDAPDAVLKEGGTAQVVAKGRWVVKRIRSKRRRQLFLDRVRRGKAVSALQNAFLLELSGIPTPRSST